MVNAIDTNKEVYIIKEYLWTKAKKEKNMTPKERDEMLRRIIVSINVLSNTKIIGDCEQSLNNVADALQEMSLNDDNPREDQRKEFDEFSDAITEFLNSASEAGIEFSPAPLRRPRSYYASGRKYILNQVSELFSDYESVVNSIDDYISILSDELDIKEQNADKPGFTSEYVQNIIDQKDLLEENIEDFQKHKKVLECLEAMLSFC